MNNSKGIVLVTGSTSGIGLGIAKGLIEANYKVIFNGRSEDKIDFLRDKYNSHYFLSGDLTSSEGQRKVLNFINEKDITLTGCIFNIGSGKSFAPGEETAKEWKDVFDVNFFGATGLVEILKDTIISNNTSLLFISSICGIENFGAPLTYTCAKSALNSYVVGLSKAWGKFGIRVNAIAPGNILFEGSVWEKKMKIDSESVLKMLDQEVALQRFGKVEDVANAATFLLSEKSSFITGAVLVVDGGQLRGN